jgi:hypothetical protein
MNQDGVVLSVDQYWELNGRRGGGLIQSSLNSRGGTLALCKIGFNYKSELEFKESSIITHVRT